MVMKNDNIVTTFDGSTALRGDCRYIKGNFYIKNKQCFLINNKWNRINNGIIYYDHYTEEWNTLRDNREYSIDTVVDVKDSKMVIGEVNKLNSRIEDFPPNDLISTVFIFAGNVLSSTLSKEVKDTLKTRRGIRNWSITGQHNISLSTKELLLSPLLFDKIIPETIKRNIQFSKFATFMYRSEVKEKANPYVKWTSLEYNKENKLFYFGSREAETRLSLPYYPNFEEEEVVMPFIFSKRLYFFREAFSKIKDLPFVEVVNPARKDQNVFVEKPIMDKIHTPSLRSKYFSLRMTDLLCKIAILGNEAAAFDSFHYSKIYPNFTVSYGASDNLSSFKRSYRYYNKPLKVRRDNTILEGLYKNCPYSFGIEYETDGGKHIPHTSIPITAGIIPFYLLKENGLIPTRDGSIRGLEYVTIPLQIKDMVFAVVNHTQILRHYCHINKYNSLHVHVGNILPRTKENIIAYYKLAYMVEYDFYSLFPLTYKNTALFKHRGYTNPLPSLDTGDIMGKNIKDTFLFSNKSVDTVFGAIYDYLSEGEVEFKGFSSENHPKDRSGVHKWQVSVRYHWFNLIPYIWGNRRTIEFRIHVPTFNENKILYYLLLLKSFLIFVDKNVNKIVKMRDGYFKQNMNNLEYIIRETNSYEVSEKLLSYLKWRRSISNRHDIDGEKEISLDMINFPEQLKIINR